MRNAFIGCQLDSLQTNDKSESRRHYKENRACTEPKAMVDALVALMLEV